MRWTLERFSRMVAIVSTGLRAGLFSPWWFLWCFHLTCFVGIEYYIPKSGCHSLSWESLLPECIIHEKMRSENWHLNQGPTLWNWPSQKFYIYDDSWHLGFKWSSFQCLCKLYYITIFSKLAGNSPQV